GVASVWRDDATRRRAVRCRSWLLTAAPPRWRSALKGGRSEPRSSATPTPARLPLSPRRWSARRPSLWASTTQPALFPIDKDKYILLLIILSDIQHGLRKTNLSLHLFSKWNLISFLAISKGQTRPIVYTRPRAGAGVREKPRRSRFRNAPVVSKHHRLGQQRRRSLKIGPSRNGGHNGPDHRNRAGRSHRHPSTQSRPRPGLLPVAWVRPSAPGRERRCRA